MIHKLKTKGLAQLKQNYLYFNKLSLQETQKFCPQISFLFLEILINSWMENYEKNI